MTKGHDSIASIVSEKYSYADKGMNTQGEVVVSASDAYGMLRSIRRARSYESCIEGMKNTGHYVKIEDAVYKSHEIEGDHDGPWHVSDNEIPRRLTGVHLAVRAINSKEDFDAVRSLSEETIRDIRRDLIIQSNAGDKMSRIHEEMAKQGQLVEARAARTERVDVKSSVSNSNNETDRSNIQDYSYKTTFTFDISAENRKKLDEQLESFSRKIKELNDKYEDSGVSISVEIEQQMERFASGVQGTYTVNMRARSHETLFETGDKTSFDDKVKELRNIHSHIRESYEAAVSELDSFATDVNGRKKREHADLPSKDVVSNDAQHDESPDITDDSFDLN